MTNESALAVPMTVEQQAKMVADEFFDRTYQGKTYEEIVDTYQDKFTPEQLESITKEFFDLSQQGSMDQAVALLTEAFKDSPVAVGLMAPYVEKEYIVRRAIQDTMTQKIVEKNVDEATTETESN